MASALGSRRAASGAARWRSSRAATMAPRTRMTARAIQRLRRRFRMDENRSYGKTKPVVSGQLPLKANARDKRELARECKGCHGTEQKERDKGWGPAIGQDRGNWVE